jgi:alginate O-acetyltransferase complex protein AlgJ
MLRHYRRYWACLASLILALPLLFGLAVPVNRTISNNEARILAPLPSLPDSQAGWQQLPRRMDAYLRDHFGLRQALLRAYGLIMSNALSKTGNKSVLMGSDGWMYYRGDNMVQQSAGIIRRGQNVAEAADLLAKMQVILAARNTRLLVAAPPNATTIYPDHLPLWARNRGQRTEYDLFLTDLAIRGVRAVDLRPVLRAAEAQGPVYRQHDTHWTPRGALAAFNAIVHADSHPHWKVDPDAALGSPTTIVGGDLARMLGVNADVTETDQLLALPPGKREFLQPEGEEFTPYLATNGRPGPTIMIIGDSFTVKYLAPMLLQHVGRVVWLHHGFCRFNWKRIDQFRPDEVWWMPAERYIVCRPGNRPTDMPP